MVTIEILKGKEEGLNKMLTEIKENKKTSDLFSKLNGWLIVNGNRALISRNGYDMCIDMESTKPLSFHIKSYQPGTLKEIYDKLDEVDASLEI